MILFLREAGSTKEKPTQRQSSGERPARLSPRASDHIHLLHQGLELFEAMPIFTRPDAPSKERTRQEEEDEADDRFRIMAMVCVFGTIVALGLILLAVRPG